MKKILLKLFLILGFFSNAQVKVGDNPTSLTSPISTALELESTTKALLINRVTNTAAVTNPVNGMIVYDLSLNCFRGYQFGVWSACGFVTSLSPTTNGTGIVSGYNCSTSSTGTMTIGTAVSGVTQTITATVTTVGTYNINAVLNGVSFSGSGTFAATGAQNIVLTAIGTPTTAGANSFSINTTPNCNFVRPVNDTSTNGTGGVTSYSCSAGSTGTMTVGIAVTGVTQTITATVGTIGTYNLSTVTNGVTFSASGTFAALGAQNIVLTATGTPTAAGVSTFSLNTTPTCSFNRTIISQSTNGDGIVTAYNCGIASAGTMTVGVAVAGVTQTISATVGTLGSYNISTTANGVTFSASGTFTILGTQNIVLNATGTPAAVGTNTYTLNTNPNCNFNRTTVAAPISIPGNATCVGKTISATGCAGLGGATLNDNGATADGIEYDWANATNINIGVGFGAPTNVRALTQIGNQCWAAFNSNVVNGNDAPAANDGTDRGSSDYYPGGPYGSDGLMYQWSAAMNGPGGERGQGVCPNGFHVPSDCEWMYLENTLGMSVAEQEQLNGWRNTGAVGVKLSNLTNGGNNSTGFSAQLAGDGYYFPVVFNRTINGPMWSSSTDAGNGAYASYREIFSGYGSFYRNTNNKAHSYSVRCLRN
jgi:uncharacterized protein (TIGR02145 family)